MKRSQEIRIQMEALAEEAERKNIEEPVEGHTWGVIRGVGFPEPTVALTNDEAFKEMQE